jgi:protein SCO1/2
MTFFCGYFSESFPTFVTKTFRMKLGTIGKRVLFFAIIFFAGVVWSYQLIKPKTFLPIYNPSDLDNRLVDESLQKQTSKHRTLPFSLTAQTGEIVTEAFVKNKIYVADFFFVTCPSICPKMTKNLERVAEEMEDEKDFAILSHSVMPEQDSVPVLAEYAKKHKANPEQWLFLTGEQKHIYNLARKSYFAVLDEPSEEGPDFVHTENFILVDKAGRLRGFYDGTSPDEIDRLLNDLEILFEEYDD